MHLSYQPIERQAGLIKIPIEGGRVTWHHGLAEDFTFLIHDADDCQFQSNVHSGIVWHGHFSFYARGCFQQTSFSQGDSVDPASYDPKSERVRA